jgi:acyl-CoA synthetase (AMP-forming)/AMP-acid ligase II
MFAVSDSSEAVSVVAAGVSAQLDFGVVDQHRLDEELRRRLAEQGVLVVEADDAPLPSETSAVSTVEPGRVSVLTSGTTGLPKLIAHTADSLNTFDRVRQLASNQWFLPYQVGSYAWYQMVSMGLFVEGQDLVLGESTDLMLSFEEALRHGQITAVSSTPTFWRQAIFTIEPPVFQTSPIRTISLGGEIVDNAILDHLKSLFPKASIKHIYASSEVGAAIVVSDGKAGFDEALLDAAEDKPVLIRIVDGRLHVRSRYGNTGSRGEWIDTGDLVERHGGRVVFCGRADNQMINVGGQKAYPALIEARLLLHPNVAWAQVVAKRAPMMGYLPMAHVVLHSASDPLDAEQQLTAFCEGALPEYAVPRIWNFLEAIPTRASLKS